MNWRWFVYILLCEDDSYYTGMTWQPDLRWQQHVYRLGGTYTAEHPVRSLVYLEEYEHLETARIREKQIKGWSRVKKEKLITGQWGPWI